MTNETPPNAIEALAIEALTLAREIEFRQKRLEDLKVELRLHAEQELRMEGKDHGVWQVPLPKRYPKGVTVNVPPLTPTLPKGKTPEQVREAVGDSYPEYFTERVVCEPVPGYLQKVEQEQDEQLRGALLSVVERVRHAGRVSFHLNNK
jgi:hypothetical protein